MVTEAETAIKIHCELSRDVTSDNRVVRWSEHLAAVDDAVVCGKLGTESNVSVVRPQTVTLKMRPPIFYMLIFERCHVTTQFSQKQ